eukprot:6192043-Pleurochrysis_carterae.AAC.2
MQPLARSFTRSLPAPPFVLHSFLLCAMPTPDCIRLGCFDGHTLTRRVSPSRDGRLSEPHFMRSSRKDNSRLGCQIVLSPELDGLQLRLPMGANNMFDHIPFG